MTEVQLCCGYDYAKKIYDLGFTCNKSMFIFSTTALFSENATDDIEEETRVLHRRHEAEDYISGLPAWTAAELKYIIGDRFGNFPAFDRTTFKSTARGMEVESTYKFVVNFPKAAVTYNTEADALAACLIFLLENGNLDLKEAKERAEEIL